MGGISWGEIAQGMHADRQTKITTVALVARGRPPAIPTTCFHAA